MGHERTSGKLLAAFVAGAAVVLAAGGYLFYGPKGRKHRRELEHWIDDAKEDMLDRMAELKDVSRQTYNTIVDEVVEDYSLAKDLTKAEAQRLGTRFKARYREMKEMARDAARDARREASEDEE